MIILFAYIGKIICQPVQLEKMKGNLEIDTITVRIYAINIMDSEILWDILRFPKVP